MDLAGIEPASESLFIEASPITVAVLTFPWMYAHRQAYNLSSFMIHLPGQSLPGKVSHMVDARFPMCECNGADEQLRLLTLTFRLRLYLVPGWYAVQESADGFPNFKAPVETSTSPENESATLFFHKTALVMRRKHFLILIYHSLYKIYRLINSIEIKTEFVKKIFIFETACYCSLSIIPRGVLA